MTAADVLNDCNRELSGYRWKLEPGGSQLQDYVRLTANARTVAYILDGPRGLTVRHLHADPQLKVYGYGTLVPVPEAIQLIREHTEALV